MADPMHSLSSLFASVSFPFHHRTPFCHSHAGCPLRPIHLPCRALYRNGSTMTKAELESSGKERGGKLQKKKEKKKEEKKARTSASLMPHPTGPGRLGGRDKEQLPMRRRWGWLRRWQHRIPLCILLVHPFIHFFCRFSRPSHHLSFFATDASHLLVASSALASGIGLVSRLRHISMA